MKVSKKSWHYRWMAKIGFRHPKNLCAYFWTTVWSTLVFPVVATVAVGASFVLSIPLWAWLVDDAVIQQLAVFIGTIEILTLFAMLLWQISERRDSERWERESRGIYTRPSLFKQWMRAKHEQVCPYLDFTND